MNTGRVLLVGPLILAAVLAVACASDGVSTTGTMATTATVTTAPPTTQASVGGTAPSDDVISMLEGRIAAWNRGDGEAAAAFYSEDGILEETDNGLVTQGRSPIAARLQDLIDAGFKMEAVGAPVQYGQVVIEPVNLIRQGRPGPYVLVFYLDGRRIDHQWVMTAGPWEGSDDLSPMTTEPPTTAGTVAASTTVTAGAATTMTTTPLSRTLKWGEGAEIKDRYATVDRPIEDTSASRPEGKKIMLANVMMGSKPGGTWRAYDEQGQRYAPVSVPWEVTAASVGPYEGPLVFVIPSDATIKRIVWDWPVFEWVNVLIWE